MSELGIDDDFIKQVNNEIQPGQAALFLLTREAVIDKVKDALTGYHCKLLHTSLSKEDEARLRETLGV
jgi:uncharacterized membrane protein